MECWQVIADINAKDAGSLPTIEVLKERLRVRVLRDEVVQAVLPIVKVSIRMWFSPVAPTAHLSLIEMLAAELCKYLLHLRPDTAQVYLGQPLYLILEKYDVVFCWWHMQ